MASCIFCAIVRRRSPAYRVYEDDDVVAFLDIHPVVRGHTLVVPKTHAKSLDVLPLKTAGALGRAVSRLGTTVAAATQSLGFLLLQNNQSCAGQVCGSIVAAL